MRKDLSDWTDQQFVEAVAALGMEYKDMARALRKHQSTISSYSTGRQRIPREVAERITAMIDAKRESLKHISNMAHANIGQLITFHNERKQSVPHRTEGRFMRRQNTPDTSTYPVYRMSRERMLVYAEALRVWHEHVTDLARTYTDEARQRDYRLELADLKALASSAPRNAPYDVCITRTEWQVIGRALLHLAKQPDKYRPAHALRSHWDRHKGCGFPVRRHTEPAAA